jgi:hypothetical protein
MSPQKQQIENHVKRIRQFNVSDELINEFEQYLVDTNLNDEQILKLCSLVERMTTQHYVRQLLKRELR